MLLTITVTTPNAPDIGYLFGKHPARWQEVALPNGTAQVFYPFLSDERITVALIADIDPVTLVRKEGNDFTLEQYVNDRPYVTSSFFSSAIAKTFNSALNGNCKDRPELVDMAVAIQAKVAVVSAKGGEAMIRRLFEPLGYSLSIVHHPLDEAFPAWGSSHYFTVELAHTCRVRDVLAHLYVLLPVLDNDKHYYIEKGEAEKLLKKGEGWLSEHPERGLITRRYLQNRSSLTQTVWDSFVENELATEGAVAEEETPKLPTEQVQQKRRLHDLRLEAACQEVVKSGAQSVVDLGCGEGRLLRLLLEERTLTKIVGMDVVHNVLKIAARKLKLDRQPIHQKDRIQLLHGSLLYRDRRLEGFDAATIVEVIEHLDEPRLAAFERVVFQFVKAKTVIITTPNAEYNAVYGMEDDSMRHADHRFEWTRAQFEAWGNRVGELYGYSVRYQPVGVVDAVYGASSQMAVFNKIEY